LSGFVISGIGSKTASTQGMDSWVLFYACYRSITVGHDLILLARYHHITDFFGEALKRLNSYKGDIYKVNVIANQQKNKTPILERRK
jgi:hypothetical protein